MDSKSLAQAIFCHMWGYLSGISLGVWLVTEARPALILPALSIIILGGWLLSTASEEGGE